MRNILFFFLINLVFSFPIQGAAQSLGGLKRWYNKEVKPTIEGKRALKIDPTRVRINQNGKDILRASTQGSGSLYLDFGVAKFKTNDLQKEIARAGAVFSGNTAVMTQIAFEQLEQVSKKKAKRGKHQSQFNVARTTN